MKDLSIIVPFVGEYPQVLFTLQALAQDFANTDVDFEVIAVNNFCGEVQSQAMLKLAKARNLVQQIIINEGREISTADMLNIQRDILPTFEDRSGPAVKSAATVNPWLKYVEYNKRLSHWQAKRHGVEVSNGRVLFFADAHVLPSKGALIGMYEEYCCGGVKGHYYSTSGSLHLPLTYKVLESHRLVYKIVVEHGTFYSYSFTPFRDSSSHPSEVPCMSTCGMMINREIYDALGGWPHNLGIYGGGENFMNYTLAVMGYGKFIYPDGTLFHHGEKRDYHYLYDDMVKNRLIAHYLFGGRDLMLRLAKITKGTPARINQLAEEVLEENKEQRRHIENQQKMTIEQWTESWIK